MSAALQSQRRPRFGKIPEALAYSGISRARFYEWVREHPELIKKMAELRWSISRFLMRS
jgi:predicted DNA-binding transcriptional regulator AlpA